MDTKKAPRTCLEMTSLYSSTLSCRTRTLVVLSLKSQKEQGVRSTTTPTAATMHLHTVHTSSYYSSPIATNTTSMRPCLNVIMTSRVMHRITACNSSTASPTQFTLHARSTDSTESQGLSRGAIIAIVAIIVAIGLILCLATTCLNHRSKTTHTKTHHRHAHRHHTNGAKGPAVPLQNYRSGAGLSAPPRSHGGRARAPQFPGPRNGFTPGGRYLRGNPGPAKGPYADSTPFSAVPTWAAAGRSMYH